MGEWIIIGAETGNSADRVTPKREWVNNIVEAASITKAAVFMKHNLVTVEVALKEHEAK